MPAHTEIRAHEDPHLLHRQGWLRAAMMGANDGILSTASLVIGVASGGASTHYIVLAGIAGAVAGAMSMAAGEYISVSSQSDLEKADISREMYELKHNPEGELAELTAIYVSRGLSQDLAQQVAQQLTEKDALRSHIRDEIGLVNISQARPVQASAASALAFAIGAIPPVIVAALAPAHLVITFVAISTIIALTLLGALGAIAGRASRWRAALRVVVWGVLAMTISAVIGQLVEVAL